MSFLSDEDWKLLREAHQRAIRLVEGIEREREELLSQRPGRLSTEALVQGKMAMENALASARRMLKAVEEAIAIAEKEEKR